MKNYFFFFLLLLTWSCSKDSNSCEATGITDFEFLRMASLPSDLAEASGIEVVGNSFWSFNDNSGSKHLYEFNQNGDLLQTRTVDFGRKDWEDIAQDSAGNIYLGDCGNNDNDREDLKIYKINSTDLNASGLLPAETIRFSLEDQTSFPPSSENKHFDVEGFFALGDQLFLFTKDRSKPFEGKTKLYQLSNEEGTHSATIVDFFSTDACDKAKGAITAADVSPDGDKVAILSEEVVWIFSEFSGSDFFDGKVERYHLPISRQMEGIVFQDECLLFLVNEKADDSAALYRMDICD